MKPLLLCLLPAIAAAQTMDANGCFAARGKTDAASVAAMARALEDPGLLTCAAANLRMAGAVEPLRHALDSDTPQVRAAAARELGALERPDMLEPLSRAAADENALVATNALAGLAQYRGAEVVPYLEAVAKKGGMVGDMSLDRLLDLDPAAALGVARGLLAAGQVPDRLYAMRVIGAAGDASDLPALRKIAAAGGENLSQRNRGFGFMPPISLARAAESAIAAIEERPRSGPPPRL